MKKSIYIGFVTFPNGVTELVSCSDKSKKKAGELLYKWLAENTVEGETTRTGVLTISDSDYIDIG